MYSTSNYEMPQQISQFTALIKGGHNYQNHIQYIDH